MSFPRVSHDLSQDDAVSIVVFSHRIVDIPADAGDAFDIIFCRRDVDVTDDIEPGVA